MKNIVNIPAALLLLFSATLVCCKKNNNSLPVIVNPDFSYKGILVTDENISFYNGSSNITWSWNFGDGGSSKEPAPVHVYTAGGTYTVSLTINGDVAHTTRKAITIAKNPGYTKSMGGLRLWRHTSNLVTPSGGSVTHYPDTSFAVEYIDPLTVAIGGSIFSYSGSSNGDSTLTFEMREYSDDKAYLIRTDYLHYTPKKDSLHWITDSLSSTGFRGAHHYIAP
jgi:hypothetical protein